MTNFADLSPEDQELCTQTLIDFLHEVKASNVKFHYYALDDSLYSIKYGETYNGFEYREIENRSIMHILDNDYYISMEQIANILKQRCKLK